MRSPAPPLTALAELDAQLTGPGWAVLDASSLARLAAMPAHALVAWAPHWDDLPPDQHLKDGGRYRRRRHGSFIVQQGRFHAVAHRAHWQPVSYNALHGGLERWFAPLPAELVADPAWQALMTGLAARAGALRGAAGVAGHADATWYGEAHLFRIDTSDGIGRPTPEGAHRDGVDLVAVVLIGRHNIKGGETRVFDADGTAGVRFTLCEAGSALLLDDERVIHESTPIQPIGAGVPAHRDTLVVTLRRGGFQDPPSTST